MTLVRRGYFDKPHHYEKIQLTVAANGSVAATDVLLDEAYLNEPAMLVVFPSQAAAVTYTITYTGATPKVTIAVADGANDLGAYANTVIDAVLILHEKL